MQAIPRDSSLYERVMGKDFKSNDIYQLLIGLVLINVATFLLDGFPKLILGGLGAIIVGYVIFKFLRPYFI